MDRNKQNNFQLTTSFTLIEILVVVTIVGVLLGVGAVSYRSITRNSRDARRKEDLEKIRQALELARNQNPNKLYSSSTLSGYCDTHPGIVALLNPYLPSVPTDPQSPTYRYLCTISTDTYTLGARMEITSTASCLPLVYCGSLRCTYEVGPYIQICPP